jgi:ribosome-associated protein
MMLSPAPLTDLSPLELARRIVEVASDRQAVDVVLLDITATATFTDYFVICNGTSERQIKAIVDTVLLTLEEEGYGAQHTEGSPTSGWVLIDYGSVIVHVFAPAERGFYKLERLWADAPTLVRVL